MLNGKWTFWVTPCLPWRCHTLVFSLSWNCVIIVLDGLNLFKVIVNGTQHLHAVWGGVHVRDQRGHFRIISVDASLVAPGDTDHLLRYEGFWALSLRVFFHFIAHPNFFVICWHFTWSHRYRWKKPNMDGGMHFNLHNNGAICVSSIMLIFWT